MARMKKDDVIAALKALNLEVGENEKYNALCKKLKVAAQGKAGDTALYKRAKKIGLSQEQIATFADATALKKYLDKISPKTNAEARPQVSNPQATKFDPDAPDVFEFDSKLETSFLMRNRSQHDEANLQAEMRKLNIKYGRRAPVRILVDIDNTLVKGKNKHHQDCDLLVTHYKVIFKE